MIHSIGDGSILHPMCSRSKSDQCKGDNIIIKIVQQDSSQQEQPENRKQKTTKPDRQPDMVCYNHLRDNYRSMKYIHEQKGKKVKKVQPVRLHIC